MGDVNVFTEGSEALSQADTEALAEVFGVSSNQGAAGGTSSSRCFIAREAIQDRNALKRFGAVAQQADDQKLYLLAAHGTAASLPGSERDGVFFTEQVFRDITPNFNAVIAGMILPKELMSLGASFAADQTIAEIGTIAFLRAQSSGIEVEFIEGNFTRAVSLTKPAIARVLSAAVECFNIEELFPNHPWADFSQESAAACYHSLAAKFIALGNYDMAIECLDRSDALEESPRSFGLRAIISREKGDVLSAIADMILSLKAYENRKDQGGTHYLKFTPSDFTPMTEALKEGLAALHRQDNEAALSRFSSAVMSFDEFYRQNGLMR